ncbi:sigma-54 dependent transcriptional regulator [bacterium]|nr:sigma-54 dependent transcriptional regulator [bacterium]
MNRVLIFEPDPVRLLAIKEQLEKKHYWVVVSSTPAEALALVRKQLFHVCLWSVEGEHAVGELHEVKAARAWSAIIATSNQSSPSLIVACVRAGASDFCPNAEDLSPLATKVDYWLSQTSQEEDDAEFEESLFPGFVGRHPRMREIFRLIQSIKDTDSTILITGESGTGKEVVARSLHDVSQRRRHPLVAVNCGAIPASLLESELFGHMKGAFTGAVQNRLGRFALAGNGTLFLDEISDLPIDLQAKLLRAIQMREFDPIGSAQSSTLDARIIAASNQDLEVAVAERRFRQDLYYRLNVIPVFLPPLRQRKTDIPLLVASFLRRFSEVLQRPIRGISEDAMKTLIQYHWPGNVRELENLIERVIVLKRDQGVIELKDFPPAYFKNVRLDRFVASVSLPEEGLDFNEAVNEFENELILQALQKTEGNKNKAATLLGLNRTTLVEKLKRKGLRITG